MGAMGAMATALMSTASVPGNSSGNGSSDPSERGFGAKQVNLNGMRKEANRGYLRAVKKVSKASERLSRAQANLDAFLSIEEPTQADLEHCPSTETCAAELKVLKERVSGLKELEAMLVGIKSIKDEGYDTAVALAASLEIGDSPPPVAPKGVGKKGKKKGIQHGPRKPYFIYTSADGIQIRVGRRADDNDELSLNPAHRDGSDWWLHAQGNAGSHVVIRSHDDTLPVTAKETLQDAAILAAVNSKGPQSGNAFVTYTRCRHVSKPAGAKAGMVRLAADIGTVRVNVGAGAERLRRLEATKEMN
jgi:predicted ribosome quality control (RQC) complex YloA/Tae2 family protein